MSKAVVFDIGRVLFQWRLHSLFEKLIDDKTTVIVPADSNLLDLLISEDP